MKRLKTLVVVATLLSAQVSAIQGFAAEDNPRDPEIGDNIATSLFAQVPVIPGFAAADDPRESGTADDMKLLQGSTGIAAWERRKGAPTIRSVKTIIGNHETLRRYRIASGELLSERTVEFELNQSGPVRVFTFHPIGGEAKSGYSYIYKVEDNEFYDITGLLHGTEYRDYSETPSIWRWTRVIEGAAAGAIDPATAKFDTRKDVPRDQNSQVTATIKDVTLIDVDRAGGVISVTFGKEARPTKLVNVPLAEGVRLVASHVIPTLKNHLPFEWENLKRLEGKVVSIRFLTSEAGISVASICERGND